MSLRAQVAGHRSEFRAERTKSLWEANRNLEPNRNLWKEIV